MLKVSRPDVLTDRIQEFPVTERYLKLPIQNYFNLMSEKLGIDFQPNGAQLAIINAINNPKYRFIVAAVARRVGKTEISNMIAQLVSLMPESNVLLMAPNYSLTQISWNKQRHFIQKLDLETKVNNAKDKHIQLVNDSNIWMGSLNQVDSVIGKSVNLILFDEAAIDPNGGDAFNLQLRPMLDRPDSKAIFISTPRGMNNYFKQFFDRGFKEEYPTWCSIHADWEASGHASEENIEDAKRGMSKQSFAQEYLASFISFEGQIFEFTPETVDDAETMRDFYLQKPDVWDVIGGIDFGYRDANAVVVIGYNWETKKWYALDEYTADKVTTKDLAKELKILEERWGIGTWFADSAAAQSRMDLATLYDISTMKAKKDVLAGIAYLQGVIETKDLVVGSNCVNLLATLDQYRWDEPAKHTLNKERPVHDEYSHMADALRYAIYTYSNSVLE